MIPLSEALPERGGSFPASFQLLLHRRRPPRALVVIQRFSISISVIGFDSSGLLTLCFCVFLVVFGRFSVYRVDRGS